MYGALTNYKSAGWAIPEVPDAGFLRPSTYGTPDIICHKGAINGKEHVPIRAGSAVDLFWENWPKDHLGPVITYLADCKGPCDTVDKTKLEFFKIDEAGLIVAKPKNKWATTKLIEDGLKWTVTIPADIRGGNYVLRHELIAIGGAHIPDGAQDIPQCINFEVIGNGTATPKGVPGMQLYKPTDVGVTIDIRKDIDSYPIPGPPLYKSGSAAEAPESYDDKPASSSSATTSSATGAPEAYDVPEMPEAYDAGTSPTTTTQAPKVASVSVKGSASSSGKATSSSATAAPEAYDVPEMPEAYDAGTSPTTTQAPKVASVSVKASASSSGQAKCPPAVTVTVTVTAVSSHPSKLSLCA